MSRLKSFIVTAHKNSLRGLSFPEEQVEVKTWEEALKAAKDMEKRHRYTFIRPGKVYKSEKCQM